MFGVMTSMKVAVVEDAAEAIEQGFNYTDGDYKAVEIVQAIVVRNGTEAGRPSVDFILQDEDGNKYVVLLTGALLKALPL